MNGDPELIAVGPVRVGVACGDDPSRLMIAVAPTSGVAADCDYVRTTADETHFGGVNGFLRIAP